ncbi:MAG: lysophospholipid acyltransferase family protein, partial [Bdellovibrionota bacterium]
MGSAVLSLVSWLYYVQPAPVRAWWGSALGGVLRLYGLRSAIVRENLARAFPSDPDRQRRLASETYRHLGRLVLEILLLLGPMRRFVRSNVLVTGEEHWSEAKRQGRGVIFLTSHVGNWEIMAATGGVRFGMDILLVTKILKPAWLHAAIEKGRARCGVTATYEPRTMRDVLGHLKQNGTVGFILDQYAGPPISVRVPVFGIPVGTTTAVAMVAKRTGAVVLPVVNYRLPDGRTKIEIAPPLEWEAHGNVNEELARNTARYAEVLQSHILAHPENWLWIHRRFKGDLSPLRLGEWSE